MDCINFEEWELAPEARYPGWHFVEGFARSALDDGYIERVVIFERASSSQYELKYTHHCSGGQTAELGGMIRDALRRDALLGFVLRGSHEPIHLLENYRCNSRKAIQLRDAAREFDADVLGLDAVLTAGRRLILVSHDGDPLFSLILAST